jgi:2,3-bisphosphoglycerate-dependent phosphoglycerate mutase
MPRDDHALVRFDFQRPFAAPEGAQEILLVRHGAVDPPGPGGLVGGRSDPPLNERGRGEAALVARRLVRERVCAVFATQLRRAIETAEVLAGGHGIEPVPLPALGEVYLGEWEGHGIHDRGARGDPEFVRMMGEQRWDLIPGAEPAEEFSARVREGLGAVADAAAPGAVSVAVTHGAVIAEACRQVTRSEPFAFLTNANGSLTRIVRMPDRRWRLLTFNETEHLQAHGAEGEVGGSR